MSALAVTDTTSPFWRSIVYIETTFPNGARFVGSGVLVGQNDVLTASHVLYMAQQGGAATSVKVVPAYDASPYRLPYGEIYSTSYHYFSSYDPDGTGLLAAGNGGAGLVGSELDIAIIDLSVAVGNQTGWMSLDRSFGSGAVNVTGFPVYYGTDMMNDNGIASQDTRDSIILYGGIETHPGNSGGPIWYEGQDGAHVVGVVSTALWGASVQGTYDQLMQWIAGNDALLSTDSVIVVASAASPSTVITSAASTAGSEIFHTGDGNHTIAGGAGVDTAIYPHARHEYTIVGTLGGSMTVSRGQQGTDTLTGVEALVFTDVQHGGAYRDGGETKYADINADGRADMIFQGEDNTFWLSLSHGNGYDPAVRTVQHGGSYRNGGETHYADVNGDGRADLIFEGTDNTFWLSLTNAGGLTNAVRSVQHGGNYRNGAEAQFADVNADGKADLIFQGEDNTFWLSLSDSNGLTNAVRSVQHGGTYRNGRETNYADVNGDGKADLVFQGEDNTFWLSISDSNGLTNAVRSVQHGGSYRNGGETQLADVSGDGKADLIFQAEDNTFWLSPSTGGGFTNAVQTVQHGGQYRDGSEVHFADVTGDLKADMIFQAEDNSFWLSTSTGSGFNPATLIIDLPGSYRAGAAQFADLTGDARSDFIFQTLDNVFHVSVTGSDYLLT